jgi:type I restriction enzyme M protein
MANSASDARSSELELRKQLIQARAVDAIVAVGPNMFYTVTLPCTLWFLDRGKKKTPRADKLLFIDARHVYRQIDRAHRDWTEAQIGFLANIVRLYRDEEPDFTLGGDEAKAKLIECFSPSPSSSGEGRGEGKKGAALRAAKPSARYLGVRYRDIPGLCKAASLKEIEAQSWSLNPGRYVGVAPGEEVSDEDFKEKLEALNEELESLNKAARGLEERISHNVAELLG